jgi:Na+-driven multidrug efflux pump
MAVDAIFISRFVGTLAMASVNIIMPIYCFSLGIGIMIASGSSAIIGIELGEEKHDIANGHFSFIFCFLFAVFSGIVVSGYLIGVERLSLWLGATEKLLPYCVDYLNIFLLGIAALTLQMFFEFTIRLDGKPSWAFDYLLIVRFDMGIQGAAIASVSGIVASCLFGASYFLFTRSTLKPVRPLIDFRFLFNAMINGSSEMISEVSSGVKTLVFNYIIIRYAGEAGVAAMSIVMYMFFLLSSLYIGLCMGVSPVISFNFGSKNFEKIRELLSMSMQLTLLIAVLSFGIGMFYGDVLVLLFAKGQDQVITLAEEGMMIVAASFLINGINILGSAFFTSVNNGKISALMSALRTFVFTLGFAAVLPLFMGMDGVWLSIPAAEALTLLVTFYFMIKYRGVYLDIKEIAPSTVSSLI